METQVLRRSDPGAPGRLVTADGGGSAVTPSLSPKKSASRSSAGCPRGPGQVLSWLPSGSWAYPGPHLYHGPCSLPSGQAGEGCAKASVECGPQGKDRAPRNGCGVCCHLSVSFLVLGVSL